MHQALGEIFVCTNFRTYNNQFLCATVIFFKSHHMFMHVRGEFLKESLHIHLMKIVFFEINQIYSLGRGQMIAQEKTT